MPAEPVVAPRWGVSDALIGWVVAFLLANLVSGVVLGATGHLDTHAPDPPLWMVALLQIPLWVALLGAVVVASRRKGTGRLSDDFGLVVQARDPAVGIPIGAIVQFIVVPLLYVPIFWVFGHHDVSAAARELTDKAEGVGIALLAVLVVIGAPVVEELFFRGLVLRAFERRYGPTVGLLASSALFGLAHFQLLQLPALIVFGLVVGTLAQRTGRLGPGIFAHAAFNAVTVIVLVATR